MENMKLKKVAWDEIEIGSMFYIRHRGMKHIYTGFKNSTISDGYGIEDETYYFVLDTTPDPIDELTNQKDIAYSERNKLVSVISKCFPAYLAKHEESDTTWEDDWRNIVVVEMPTGQCSWHIHDSELELFSHLKLNPDYKWDGHSTEEKYQRLFRLELGITNLGDANTSELIGELAKRSNEQIVMAFRTIGDGGETLTRFYNGTNSIVINLGLSQAIKLQTEAFYLKHKIDSDDED